MPRNILALDFYGSTITAALASLDDDTRTLRIRHVLRRTCRSFSGAFVRDMAGAEEGLNKVFAEMNEYINADPSVVVGLRGNFLSFKSSSGFKSIDTRNRIIGDREIDEAIRNSVPINLSDTLEVVDILPQSYMIDGNTGILDPKGMAGFTLEIGTFLSYALVTHLNNLNNVLSACNCPEYALLPSSVALGETLLTEGEKRSGALLLDLGEESVSALLYNKGILLDGIELPYGLNRRAEAVADLLQNDVETAQEVLNGYEPGADEIMDEVIEDAESKMLQGINKEILQAFCLHLKYPSPNLILCGSGATKQMVKTAKAIFNAKKARLGVVDHLISDCPADNPAYTGALALIRHTLEREQNQLGVAQTKESGLFTGFLDKLGQLFEH